MQTTHLSKRSIEMVESIAKCNQEYGLDLIIKKYKYIIISKDNIPRQT